MNNKSEALERAIQIAGGQTELKRLIIKAGREVSQQTISAWRKAGAVSIGWAVWVARAVDFKVTPNELDPDAYPNRWDGLPLDRARPLILEAPA